MTKAEKEKYKDSAFIYSLEYPEGNVRYIGKTIDLKRRYVNHLYSAKEEKTKKKSWISSLKKKGLKPIMNVIDIVPEKESNFWEIHYIALFKSFGFDLTNGTFGGDGQSHITKEVRERISTKVKLYKSQHPNWNKGTHGLMFDRTGWKSSEETKLKVSLNNPRRKTVYQFTLDGKIVKKWLSARQVGIELNVDQNYITKCCIGKAKTCRGFLWSYKPEPPKINLFYERTVKICTKATGIAQYDLNHNLIHIWKTRQEIKDNLGQSWFLTKCFKEGTPYNNFY